MSARNLALVTGSAGKGENSPLLKQEEEALYKSYSLLKEAIQFG